MILALQTTFFINFPLLLLQGQCLDVQPVGSPVCQANKQLTALTRNTFWGILCLGSYPVSFLIVPILLDVTVVKQTSTTLHRNESQRIKGKIQIGKFKQCHDTAASHR